LGDVKTEIFLQTGLDTPVDKPPDGQITGLRQEHIALVSRTQLAGLMDECRVLDDVGAPERAAEEEPQRSHGLTISSL
jgi:hypothetical protein